MAKINLQEVSISQFEQTLDIHQETGHSFMLWGSPGIGKSQVIKDWCHRNGYHIVVRMLSQMQPSDFIIPHVDKQTNQTHWAVADWLANLPTDRPSVVFLDELPAAPVDVQVAA